MDRIAFVFSGQGDQYPGMGRELYEKYSCAAEVFRSCDAIRPGTSDQCFFGSEEELKETGNTQPCLFAVESAIARTLTENGIIPCAAAGFSLGEIAALTFTGRADLETGFRIVCRRGEIMQKAADEFETSMAAVVKLTNEKVEELCRSFEGVYPVNYNCPGQVSVAGLTASMPAFFAAVKEAGGRAIPLKVKGAFHSPFMAHAAEEFADAIRDERLSEGSITLYSDVTGEPYCGDEKSLLSRQICSPVLFERIIRNMIAGGINVFIEIGPGKTLTNMIKKTDAQVSAYSASDPNALFDELAGRNA